MSRNIKDKLLSAVKALPAAGASAETDSFDLGSDPWPTVEQVQMRVTVPDLPALVDTKTVTLTFQDSVDNSSFAAIPELSTLVFTGVNTPGADGGVRTVALPPSVRRYVNVKAEVEAAGGDNTGVSITAELLF